MATDEEIRQGLRNSGVPQTAFGTTLLKEDAPALRALIADHTLVTPTSVRGLYLYPSKKTSTMQARKLFYLVAKELFLSGTSICCLPLARLLEALNSDDYSGEAARVEQVRMVLVLDFYEEGAPFPFTPYDAVRLRTWVRKRFESGNGVSFLSDAPVDRCSAWWPQSFLGFINDNVIIHPV